VRACTATLFLVLGLAAADRCGDEKGDNAPDGRATAGPPEHEQWHACSLSLWLDRGDNKS
jgi:hypothetical protein